MEKYYVTLIKGDDEFHLISTEVKEEAIARAKDELYYIERDKRKSEEVEIRVYVQDIETEDCDCFDYDTVEF